MAIDNDAWFAKRQCTDGRGVIVEIGKAAKKENLGAWYVRDRLGLDDARLHLTFKDALRDYMDRCLHAQELKKKPKGKS